MSKAKKVVETPLVSIVGFSKDSERLTVNEPKGGLYIRNDKETTSNSTGSIQSSSIFGLDKLAEEKKREREERMKMTLSSGVIPVETTIAKRSTTEKEIPETQRTNPILMSIIEESAFEKPRRLTTKVSFRVISLWLFAFSVQFS